MSVSFGAPPCCLSASGLGAQTVCQRSFLKPVCALVGTPCSSYTLARVNGDSGSGEVGGWVGGRGAREGGWVGGGRHWVGLDCWVGWGVVGSGWVTLVGWPVMCVCVRARTRACVGAWVRGCVHACARACARRAACGVRWLRV